MDNFGNKRIPEPAPGNQFNSFAAGKKRYGGGRSMPNIGPVDDKLGYKTRDLKAAVMRRLKSQDSGDYMKPDNLKWR